MTDEHILDESGFSSGAGVSDEQLKRHFERAEHSMTNLDSSIGTLLVKEDENGELYIVLPDGVLNQMGWDTDTLLEWHQGDGDEWHLKKHEETK